MTIPLKQSTASQEIPLGYFLDSTDGDAEETGLTIANTDIKLWKHGATTLVNKNSGGATHISNGIYYCVLDDTDTNTLGGLEVFVHVSGALAIKVDCEVYPANVYDSLYSTDKLQVDVTQCGGSTVASGAIPNAAADAAGGLPVSDAGGLDIDTKLANTNEITAARMGVLTDWINGGRLDLILDIIAADTTTDIPAKLLAYVQLLSRSDAAITADNATELTAINADGGSGAGNFSNQTDAEEAIRDRGDAAWSAAAGNPNVLIDTTIAAVTDQTHFTLTSGSDIDDAYKNQAVVMYDASNNDYPSVRVIADYVGASKTITLDSTPDFTILAGDGVKTFVTAPGTTAPTVGQIRAEMEGAGTKLTLALEDTGELQTDWANGGRLDLILDIIAADTTTDIPALIAALNDLSAANVNTEVSDVFKIDTIAEIAQGDPPATPTFEEIAAYLYFKLRNKTTTTATEDALYDNAGTTKLIKSTLSDDSTTFTKEEYISGA